MSDFIEEGGVDSPDGGKSSRKRDLGDSARKLFSSNKKNKEAKQDAAGQIVSARGTEDGLVFRIDGGADWDEICADLENLLGGKRKFFEGGNVFLEWLERLPTQEQISELELLLSDKYDLSVTKRKKKSFRSIPGGLDDAPASEENSVTVPLFDQLEEGVSSREFAAIGEGLDIPRDLLEDNPINLDFGSEIDPTQGPVTSRATSEELRKKYINRVSEILEEEMMLEGDANAKIVFGTLRSGQKVETPFSLVVLGDVNPGADLTAGGDIIIFGSLRGTAHASAYDDEARDKVIIALKMQPAQLRIGSVISRGSDDSVASAEIARIDDRKIIVEPYNPRSLPLRKRGMASR